MTRARGAAAIATLLAVAACVLMVRILDGASRGESFVPVLATPDASGLLVDVPSRISSSSRAQGMYVAFSGSALLEAAPSGVGPLRIRLPNQVSPPFGLAGFLAAGTCTAIRRRPMQRAKGVPHIVVSGTNPAAAWLECWTMSAGRGLPMGPHTPWPWRRGDRIKWVVDYGVA